MVSEILRQKATFAAGGDTSNEKEISRGGMS
jgi:hypothetical protein